MRLKCREIGSPGGPSRNRVYLTSDWHLNMDGMNWVSALSTMWGLGL